MAFNGVFSWSPRSEPSGAHVRVTVDESSGDVETVEVLAPLVDDEVAVVIASAFRALDAHTTSARAGLVERALDGAKSEVGIGGRLTGKAGRFAAEARAVVPRESFSDTVGAVTVTVDGELAFVSCTVDETARAGQAHDTLLRHALDARSGAIRHALKRWSDAGAGALEAAIDEPAALPPPSS